MKPPDNRSGRRKKAGSVSFRVSPSRLNLAHYGENAARSNGLQSQ